MSLNLKSIFKSKPEHDYSYHKTPAGKFWHFIAHDDSWLSFIADAIIILLLGKFVILPLIGIGLGTGFPLVAVVSGSMDHEGTFDDWWATHGSWYEQNGIAREEFMQFPHYKGFSKGDVFIVKGVELEEVKVGDVIVYKTGIRPDPIIHRVVFTEPNVLSTKGDANEGQIDFEIEIRRNQLQGIAVARIPYIGWVKVAFIELINAAR
jgi:signal peptidase I